MKYDPIMCMMVDDSVKTKDANTLYETFAHGRSKHAGVLEMNGKVKVVIWNEGDNPRTGKVTVIGEDTPANRNKAKSMLDSNTIDHAIRSCDISMYERIYQEAKAAVGGKYGIISNLSDLETAINDANRQGEKEDAKKLKEIYKKYN